MLAREAKSNGFVWAKQERFVWAREAKSNGCVRLAVACVSKPRTFGWTKPRTFSWAK